MQKTLKKNICEILNFSRSQLSFRARKKRSVGSWCPTYIFLLPKRYINNLQQELGQKLLKPWRKIIFNEKVELFLCFPANPTLKTTKNSLFTGSPRLRLSTTNYKKVSCSYKYDDWLRLRLKTQTFYSVYTHKKNKKYCCGRVVVVVVVGF